MLRLDRDVRRRCARRYWNGEANVLEAAHHSCPVQPSKRSCIARLIFRERCSYFIERYARLQLRQGFQMLRLFLTENVS